MEAKRCPLCGIFPEIRTKKTGLTHFCSINCPNIGCKYFYPIVYTAWTKDKAKEKAISHWNERVDTHKGTVNFA